MNYAFEKLRLKAANRRKSLNAIMLKNAFDLPQQHRPGWNGQRIQITNVDIEVEPGWTVVPLSVIKELKVRTSLKVPLTLYLCFSE